MIESDIRIQGQFVRSALLHLFVAVGVLVLIEVSLFQTFHLDRWFDRWLNNGWAWAIILGQYLGVTAFACFAALRVRQRLTQYLLLFGYVGIQAIVFFAPVLWQAARISPRIPIHALVATPLIVGSFFAYGWFAGHEFSRRTAIILLATAGVLVFLVLGLAMGPSLGLFLIVSVIIAACIAMACHVPTLKARCQTEQDISAAVLLLGGVATDLIFVLGSGV